MSAELRWEQCCESPGCTKPAHHGALCAACFYAATPARRAAELLGSTRAAGGAFGHENRFVSDEGAAWLARMWAA